MRKNNAFKYMMVALGGDVMCSPLLMVIELIQKSGMLPIQYMLPIQSANLFFIPLNSTEQTQDNFPD